MNELRTTNSRFTPPLVVLISLATLIPAASEGSKKRPPKIPTSTRVMNVIKGIEDSLVETKYQHWTKVKTRAGKYFFDCSGMASWILRRSAPAAIRVIGKPNGRRPLAVHFFNKINRIPEGKKWGPWKRVADPALALPGDVIAWKRPKWFPSKSTGHVAFVVGFPRANDGPVKGTLVRIADASKFKHEDDSRAADVTGYGTGVLLIPTDTNQRPTGYGWFGSKTQEDWVVPAELVIGRPLH